jgi:hypothetical protein
MAKDTIRYGQTGPLLGRPSEYVDLVPESQDLDLE